MDPKKPKSKDTEDGKVDRYSRFNVEIQGRTYRTVAGRIAEFWDRVKEGGFLGWIETKVSYEGKEIRVEAVAKMFKEGDAMPVPVVCAYGHASEIVGDSMINRGSALENCETSAVGRALGNLGIGIIGAGGVASADEVRSAVGKASPAVVGAAGGERKIQIANPDAPMSDAQRAKIFAQLKQLGHTKEWFEEKVGPVEKLTKGKASELIDRMEKKLADIKTNEVPTIDIGEEEGGHVEDNQEPAPF